MYFYKNLKKLAERQTLIKSLEGECLSLNLEIINEITKERLACLTTKNVNFVH